METINIIFSSDNNYAQFMGVAICSIFENKKEGYAIDIYVLDGGIKKYNKNKLKILEDRYNFKINYIKIDTNLFKDFHLTSHFTQATYYRIMAPKLLPYLKKILYLDCDITILGDIYELYNINIDDYFFAAVEEYVTDRQEELGMPINTKYFNAGVMLINLEKWRDFNITKKVIDYITDNSEKLRYVDQDALNATMWREWLNINFRYNYTTLTWEKYPLSFNDVGNKILIIHYTGLKPWNYSSTNIFKNKYFFYLKKTKWRDKKYIDKNKVMIKKILKKILVFILSKKTINKIKTIKSRYLFGKIK